MLNNYMGSIVKGVISLWLYPGSMLLIAIDFCRVYVKFPICGYVLVCKVKSHNSGNSCQVSSSVTSVVRCLTCVLSLLSFIDLYCSALMLLRSSLVKTPRKALEAVMRVPSRDDVCEDSSPYCSPDLKQDALCPRGPQRRHRRVSAPWQAGSHPFLAPRSSCKDEPLSLCFSWLWDSRLRGRSEAGRKGAAGYNSWFQPARPRVAGGWISSRPEPHYLLIVIP